MRTGTIKLLFGGAILGAVVFAPLQIAGAAQSGDVRQGDSPQSDFQQSFDTAFGPRPAAHGHARIARVAGPLPAVRVTAVSADPAPLAVPLYLARPQAGVPTLSAPAPLAAFPARSPYSPIYAGPYAGPATTPVDSPFERRLTALAEGSRGRIGVAALDLTTGGSVAVLGDQPFPLASTVKVAIVATFLAGVDEGRFHLGDRYPMMYPLPSARRSSAIAPARPGEVLSAQDLIERAMTLSDNHATDGLLAAVGGPRAVDAWLRRVGLTGMRIDRNINTLVRDDGLINPATTIDLHDSTTPQTMVRLLAGLYQGNWLSAGSREVLMGAMSRCRTGVHRMRLLLPSDALIGHKTGTLANTSSDVGIIRTPGGHAVVLAIYVTGQGSKPDREARIATIARAVYDGYQPTQLAGGSAVQ